MIFTYFEILFEDKRKWMWINRNILIFEYALVAKINRFFILHKPWNETSNHLPINQPLRLLAICQSEDSEMGVDARNWANNADHKTVELERHWKPFDCETKNCY